MKTKLASIMLIILAIVLGRCTSSPQPLHDCPPESLVLDETVFPLDSRAGELLVPLPDGGGASAGRTIYLGRRGIANHDVYPYKRPEGADQEFRRQKDRIRSSTIDEQWSVPEGFMYSSPIAEQYYVACGVDGGIPMCIMIAQYDNYFVFFNAHMYPDEMTFEDMERVLRAIDERMASCLNRDLQE